MKADDLIKSYIDENDLESAVTAKETRPSVGLAALWLINDAMWTMVFMTEDPKLTEAQKIIHEEAKRLNKEIGRE